MMLWYARIVKLSRERAVQHRLYARRPGARSLTGAIITPIYQTSTYVQEELGKHKGYEYARTQNPTRVRRSRGTSPRSKAARRRSRSRRAWRRSTRSRTMLKAGDHVVVTDNTYGGTFRLFDKVLTRYGDRFTYVDTSNLDAVEQAITPTTRMLFVETPTNPVMRLTDLARRRRPRAPPRRCGSSSTTRSRARTSSGRSSSAPTSSMHSTTKYLNGHSDSVGGVVVATRDDDIEWLRFVQNAAGAILSPFDSWLVLRGTKTLPSGWSGTTRTAWRWPSILAAHPKVRHGLLPGPADASAARAGQAADATASAECSRSSSARSKRRGGAQRRPALALAESLGGVETLISHPATMTHASVPAERRAALGITDGWCASRWASRTSRT